MKIKPYLISISFVVFSNLLIGQNATITINEDEKILEILETLQKSLGTMKIIRIRITKRRAMSMQRQRKF